MSIWQQFGIDRYDIIIIEWCAYDFKLYHNLHNTGTIKCECSLSAHNSVRIECMGAGGGSISNICKSKFDL